MTCLWRPVIPSTHGMHGLHASASLTIHYASFHNVGLFAVVVTSTADMTESASFFSAAFSGRGFDHVSRTRDTNQLYNRITESYSNSLGRSSCFWCPCQKQIWSLFRCCCLYYGLLSRCTVSPTPLFLSCFIRSVLMKVTVLYLLEMMFRPPQSALRPRFRFCSAVIAPFTWVSKAIHLLIDFRGGTIAFASCSSFTLHRERRAIFFWWLKRRS